MKTENPSNLNRIFLDWIGLDLILKRNQLDEQITDIHFFFEGK